MTEILDLSHIIADGTFTYPGLPGRVTSDHVSREQSRLMYAPGYEFQIGASSWSPTRGPIWTRRSIAFLTVTISPGSTWPLSPTSPCTTSRAGPSRRS